MKRSFSPMNAQHAPSPWQAWPFGALQIASISAQRTTGGIVIARKYSASSVRIVLKRLLNRLARSQSMSPCVRGGGVSAGIGSSSWVMSVIGSALDQRDGAVVEVHEQRDQQADREIDRHDHRDSLDRLAGL